MTRSTGVGRGGARLGGGRKKGSKNRSTILTEVLPRLEETDQPLPLYGLLNRIADESLDPRYRDVLRIATLPYLHPKMRSDMTAKPFYLMSAEELDQVERAQLEHERQTAKSRGHLRLIEKG